MAAGLTVREENFARFAEAFRSAARDILSEEALQRCLRLDHELPFSEIDVEFLRWHELLQPFGSGNPQPIFFARAVEPVAPPRVANEKHLIFRLRQGDRHRRAVYFDGAATEFPPAPWDVAFRIGVDQYEGETLVAMRIEAVRAAEAICGDEFKYVPLIVILSGAESKDPVVLPSSNATGFLSLRIKLWFGRRPRSE